MLIAWFLQRMRESLVKAHILDRARKLLGPGVNATELSAKYLAQMGVCSEHDFRACFPEPVYFQHHLMAALFSDARDIVVQATDYMENGIERLIKAFVTYLDHNLSHPGLQQLAHHLQFDPDAYEMLTRMEQGVALIAQAELEAAGVGNCASRAKLLTALAVVVVREEYKVRRPLTELREALMDYCWLTVEDDSMSRAASA